MKKILCKLKSATKVAATGVFILLSIFGTTQSNISRIEYYIDTDPGFGKAISLSITPGINIVDKVIGINPARIDEGVHRFYVRAQNANGAWSLTNSMLFYKPISSNGPAPAPPAVATNITRLEYYIDIDPGFGKGTNVSITPGTDLSNVIIPINPGPLAEGIHTFYVRARNTAGVWSFTNALPFFKPIGSSGGEVPGAPAAATNITKLEYYIDIDPGFGKGTNVSITPGTDISNVIIPINPSSLAEGIHAFYVRARNASGAWSFTNSLPFFKPIGSSGGDVPGAPSAATNITKLEYYIDIDPGYGKAINISITPGLDIKDIIVPINPASISEGVHQFYIRARNAAGSWSLTNSLLFYKPINNDIGAPALPAPAGNIVRVEYYIDTDPGYSKGKSVIITPGLDIKDVTIGVDISNLALGKHMFYARALNAKGAWSMVNALEFSNGVAITTAIASVSPLTICPGDTLTIKGSGFTESIDPGLQTIKINTIQAIIVSATSMEIKAVFNQSASGKVTVTNSIGNATSTESVTIQTLPSVSAIADQELCVGTNTTSINFSGTANSYSWKNNNIAIGLGISGTGNIAAFKTKNISGSQITSTIMVTPINTTGCNGSPTSFNIYVDPLLTISPKISQTGNTLNVISTPAGSGITGYQWMKDSIDIPGTTNNNFIPATEGSYTVSFTNSCGKGPNSNAIKVFLTSSTDKAIYVDSSATSGANNGSSWANAFTRLQDALFKATRGDTILIAKGTYYPDLGQDIANNDRNVSFIIKDSEVLLGGFPSGGSSISQRNWNVNKTILSGEIQQDGLNGNNSFHVVQTSHVSDVTTLDGFIIKSGQANSTGNTNNSGGGWYNDGSGNNVASNPTIKNCMFIYNNAGHGGAMFNTGENGGNASPVIINSQFSYNNANGGNGGGINNRASNSGKSNPTFTNCIFNGNTASNGGGLYTNATKGSSIISMVNCVSTTNAALEGAAVYNIGNQGTCTTNIVNSIVWGNKKQIFYTSGAIINLSYSLTEATTGYNNGGHNKIGFDPDFVKNNEDFHLKSGSLAINSGNNGANTLNIDLDGSARIVNNTIDMGPYEFKASSTRSSNNSVESRAIEPNETFQVQLLQNIPNPFDQSTRIGIILNQETRGVLKITNGIGQSIKIYDRVWNKGYNEIILESNELNSIGVLYYSFESLSTNGKSDFKAIRKMVITN